MCADTVICRIKVTFKDAKGEVIRAIEGNEGDDLLSLAHEYDIDLEGSFTPDIFPALEADRIVHPPVCRCMRWINSLLHMSPHHRSGAL